MRRWSCCRWRAAGPNGVVGVDTGREGTQISTCEGNPGTSDLTSFATCINSGLGANGILVVPQTANLAFFGDTPESVKPDAAAGLSIVAFV